MEDQVGDLFRKVVKTLVASMGFTTSPGVVVVDGAIDCTHHRWGMAKDASMESGSRSSYPTVPLFINSLSKRLEGRS